MSQAAAKLALEGGNSEKQLSPSAKKRSLLELAPLELACMNALWPVGEASVRDIRARLAAVRPRAYTTIMTIMDRLARKGIVERRRSGRAWLYRPNLSAEDARAHAVAQVVDGFFGGSTAALADQLGKPSSFTASPREPLKIPPPSVTPRPYEEPRAKRAVAPPREKTASGRRIDETLL